jgi:hypothetical protein
MLGAVFFLFKNSSWGGLEALRLIRRISMFVIGGEE